MNRVFVSGSIKISPDGASGADGLAAAAAAVGAGESGGDSSAG